MINRLLAWMLTFAGLALLGVTAVDYFTPTDAPGVRIHEPDRELRIASTGTSEVKFRVQNPTRHPVRLVGYEYC